MEMKNFRPLTACTSSTRKRKADAEDSSLKIGLVGCTLKEKGVSVPVPVIITCTSSKGETETLLPPSDDKTKDEEEWVHTIFSDSSDDERMLSDVQQSFDDFIKEHDCISDTEEFQRQINKEIFRRAFDIPVEKRAKLLNQKEKIWKLNVLLNKRSDITRNSCDEDVFQKLDNEGLINNIPKQTALAYINRAIWRKELFHEHDLTFELVKKLVTAVPCITVEDCYFPSRVANFVQKMGLTKIPSDMLVEPLSYIQYTLSRIMNRFHPVVHKDRIKETLSVVENDAKIHRRKWIQRWKNRRTLCFDEQIKQEESEVKSSEGYQKGLRIVQLHQEFNRHLASSSCLFIKHDMKIKNLIKDNRVVESRFEGLDKALIKASLKARIKLLKKLSELDVYNAWVLELVDCRLKEGQSRMDEILQVIRAEHPDFPKLPDMWIFHRVRDIPRGWTDKMKQEELCSFYKLLDKVKEHTRCPMSYPFVIDGISQYMQACALIEDVWTVKSKDPSSYVNFNYSARTRWLKRMAWDEICYDHPAYTAVYEDVSALM